ncbi:hypothetical protein PINS_up006289 [Pythium insidiosum]|nr:hypothetical protein PINS_up006289 [Pythium insidiosum]
MTMPQHVHVSAPAKVLLFGEHAVVYGCPSIAAALSQVRLSVFIDRIDDPKISFMFDDIQCTINGSKVPLCRQYSVEAIAAVARDYPSDDHYVPRPSTAVLSAIENVLQHTEADASVMTTLRPALFLCCAVLRASSILLQTPHTHGLRIRVSAASFPVGAGLGSSAAFSVALAGGLLQVRDQQPSSSLTEINAFAYSAEVILHGSPSGVDNTVSTFGGALKFTKLPLPASQPIDGDLSKFRILIVNTRVPRSTKALVAGVRARYDEDPSRTQSQFDAIQAIVNQFVELSADGALTESVLGQLMEQNHSILNALGVGHDEIEKVATECKREGMWTKLTGAGGGGCTVTLVPGFLAEDRLNAVMKTLESKGFQCFLSTIGGCGFSVESIA